MPKSSGFTPIPQSPLSGPLDTRSRPADLAPDAFRFKLNFALNRTGALCQRTGHAALSFGQRSDSETAVNNWDFHRQGFSRELFTTLFDSVDPDGTHRLFAANSPRVSYLDNGTSQWTDIFTGGSADGRWKIAGLDNKVAFTNNIEAPRIHTLGSGTSSTIPELTAQLVSLGLPDRLKIFIEFGGVMVGMVGDLVIWSDYRDAEVWTPVLNSDLVVGLQRLDYGDEILAACQMLGHLYIFTTRSIWRCTVNVSADSIFSFTRVYTEPEGQAGCLAYSNTVVCTGRDLYWWSQDSIWMYNQFIAAPETPDWLLKACGAQFSSDNPDRIEARCCEAPVGKYFPKMKEIWWSYPTASTADEPACVNNRCLVVNPTFKTADLVDHGYGAFVNFKESPDSEQECNSSSVFIGSSGSDYALKSIGHVFYREMVTLIGGVVATDIPDASYALTRVGYYRRLVGRCPFGYPEREKTLNGLVIQAETEPDVDLDEPNLITLRIGNSFHVADPMETDGKCQVQYHVQEPKPLECPDPKSMEVLAADQMRPDDDLGWEAGSLFEQGRHLYFDVRITAADGSAPTGSDSAWSALNWSVMTES